MSSFGKRLLRIAFRVLLVLVILVEIAYLARRPLFERLVLDQVEAILGEALDAEVRIAELRGNWLTAIELTGVEIDGRGPLRRVTAGQVAARIDLLALEPVWLRCTAGEVVIDTTTSPASPVAADPEPGSEPPELGGFAGWLADGARVDVEKFELVGPEGAFSGPVRLSLPRRARPAEEPAAVWLDAAGDHVQLELGHDGGLEFHLDGVAPQRWAKPFVDVSKLAGGRVALRGAGTIAPLRVRFALEGGAFDYDGRGVDDLEFAGSLSASGVRDGRFTLDADGVLIELRGGRVDFAEPIDSMRGSLLALILDLEPYRELLPADVRWALPVRGYARLQLEGGWLRTDGIRLRGAGVDLLADRGRWPIEAVGDGTLGFEVQLVDAAKLQALELPVTLGSGRLFGELVGTTARPRGVVGVDLTGQTTAGEAVRIAGDVRISSDDDGRRLDTQLRLTGPLAPSVGGLVVTGPVELGDRLTLAGVRIAALGPDATVEQGAIVATGSVDPDRIGDDLAALLRSARATVEIERFPIDPWVPELSGAISGSLTWAGDEPQPLALALTGAVDGLVRDTSTQLRISGAVRDAEAVLDTLSVTAEGVEVSGRASLAAFDLERLIAAPESILDLACEGRLDVEIPELAALNLPGQVTLRGGLESELQLGGTLRQPRPSGRLQFGAVGVGAPGAPPIERVTGVVRASLESLDIERLEAVVRGREVVLRGRVVVAGTDGYTVDAIELSDPLTLEKVTVNGRVGPAWLGRTVQTLREDSSFDVALDKVDLRWWLGLAGGAGGLKGGIVSGDLTWRTAEGRAATASLSGALDVGSFDAPVRFDVKASADAARLALSELTAASGPASVSGAATAEVGIDALLDQAGTVGDAPIAGTLVFADLDLAQIPAGSVGLEDLAGTMRGSATIGGTLGEPLPTFALEVAGGRLRATSLPRVEELSGQFAATLDTLTIEQVTMSLGAAPVTVAGSFVAPGPLLADWREGRVELTIAGESVLLYRRDGFKVRADLDLAAAGPLSNVRLGGDVKLVSSKVVKRIPLLAFGPTGGQAVHEGILLRGPDLRPHARVTLDVAVTTREPIAVDTNVFRGSLDTALRVVGPLSDPAVRGTVSATQGSVILPGCTFATSTMLLEFEQESWRFPSLTVAAEGRRHGYDVRLNVRGPYNEPEVLLASSPPLPGEEVAVLVMTGARPKTLQDRGVMGAAGVVGSYVAQEIGDYLFGSESTEAKESFVSRISLESGREIAADGTESIVIEYRVLDRIYVQGERDIYNDINFGLVYRIRFK